MQVAIDHRACRDVDGKRTELYDDLEDFFLGLTILLGGGEYAVRQHRARLMLEAILWYPERLN